MDGIKVKSSRYADIIGLGSTNNNQNKLTEKNILIDESANNIISINGIEGNQYVGHRVILGNHPPTNSTHGIIGDIYQLKQDPQKQWRCIKFGYTKVNPEGNVVRTVDSQWAPQ